MDFSFFYQLRDKQYWWLDLLFYFSISLLIATLLSYGIFVVKSSMAKSDIVKEIAALQTVGTDQQKQYETTVLNYSNKINDFNTIFKNHMFASNIFEFIQNNSMPYIWFKQFSLDQDNAAIQIFGETDNEEDLSRQVATFEGSQYVTKVGLLNSKVESSGKISFNIDMSLDPKIFDYSADVLNTTPLLTTTTPPVLPTKP